jgi:hypothetical protein
MVIAFRARPATKDVDAIFRPAQLIRELAEVVGEELGLPAGWINDGAKGFASARHEVETGDLPQFENLRVTAPVPEYLLAMKCMASRIAVGAAEGGDVADIRFLIGHLRLKSVDDAVSIVSRYYPSGSVPARARFLLEDIFAQLQEGS